MARAGGGGVCLAFSSCRTTYPQPGQIRGGGRKGTPIQHDSEHGLNDQVLTTTIVKKSTNAKSIKHTHSKPTVRVPAIPPHSGAKWTSCFTSHEGGRWDLLLLFSVLTAQHATSHTPSTTMHLRTSITYLPSLTSPSSVLDINASSRGTAKASPNSLSSSSSPSPWATPNDNASFVAAAAADASSSARLICPIFASRDYNYDWSVGRSVGMSVFRVTKENNTAMRWLGREKEGWRERKKKKREQERKKKKKIQTQAKKKKKAKHVYLPIHSTDIRVDWRHREHE